MKNIIKSLLVATAIVTLGSLALNWASAQQGSAIPSSAPKERPDLSWSVVKTNLPHTAISSSQLYTNVIFSIPAGKTVTLTTIITNPPASGGILVFYDVSANGRQFTDQGRTLTGGEAITKGWPYHTTNTFGGLGMGGPAEGEMAVVTVITNTGGLGWAKLSRVVTTTGSAYVKEVQISYSRF